ncbi:MAG: hypothetical protein ACXVH3_33565, partial [Solirubrobacteraceae bacterium]
EQVRRFRDPPFGLEEVVRGRVPISDAQDVLRRCGASGYTFNSFEHKLFQINGGIVTGGDQYNVGQAGAVGPVLSAASVRHAGEALGRDGRGERNNERSSPVAGGG